MSHTGRLAIRGALTLIFLSLVLVAGFSALFYFDTTASPFLWYALLGTSVLHLRVRPSLADLLLIIVSTVLLSLVEFGSLGFPRDFRVVFSFLGLSSIGVLGVRAIWSEGAARKTLLWILGPALLFVGVGWLSRTMLYYTDVAHPQTLDLYLFSFDCSLGVQLSFLIGNWYWTWPWLHALGLFFYDGLPILIAATYAEHLACRGEKSRPVLLALFYLAPVGILFYNFFPAAGPINMFQGDFPFHPLEIAEAKRLLLEPVAIPGPRNAMPSMHMAWVLLCWWYARGLSRMARAVALAFLVFTVIATLGTGEHFLIDLVVAFPFTLIFFAVFCIPMSWKHKERVQTFLVGAAMTLAWLSLLRYGNPLFWLSSAVPWTLMAATVGAVYLQRYRLLRALDARETADSAARPVAAGFAGTPSAASE